jgi:diaminopimelate decarboxylase
MTIGEQRTGSHQFPIESLRFLSAGQALYVKERFGTPVFVYDQATMEQRARYMLGLPNAFGLTVRFSLKANAGGAIIRVFDKLGLYFDACSGEEALRAIAAGVSPSKITLTGQEAPSDLDRLVEQGVEFNVCSLTQLETYGSRFPGREVSLRLNPGAGTGAGKRLVTGGPRSSFGIWHEHISEARKLIARHKLHVKRLHHHVGSGHDPDAWVNISATTLDLSRQFGHVPIINLGGGYRVKSLSHEEEVDYYEVGSRLKRVFEDFAERTGVRPRLEIEPGTFLIANAGSLVTSVIDVVSTGKDGYTFVKVNAGLTEVVRPAFYGALHPLVGVPASEGARRPQREYVVCGHGAVPGDMFTPLAGNPDEIEPRLIGEVKPGDLLVVERAGGYCSSMNMKNFNSFPEAPEVLLRKDGSFVLIRRRQTLEQIIQNEIIPQDL